MARDPSLSPGLPGPFDPLPVCPPGMLLAPEGLPAHPIGIVSEELLPAWGKASSLPRDSAVVREAIAAPEYPIPVSWEGILVDDAGPDGSSPHRDDIVLRVGEVLEFLWGDRAEALVRCSGI